MPEVTFTKKYGYFPGVYSPEPVMVGYTIWQDGRKVGEITKQETYNGPLRVQGASNAGKGYDIRGFGESTKWARTVKDAKGKATEFWSNQPSRGTDIRTTDVHVSSRTDALETLKKELAEAQARQRAFPQRKYPDTNLRTSNLIAALESKIQELEQGASPNVATGPANPLPAMAEPESVSYQKDDGSPVIRATLNGQQIAIIDKRPLGTKRLPAGYTVIKTDAAGEQISRRHFKHLQDAKAYVEKSGVSKQLRAKAEPEAMAAPARRRRTASRDITGGTLPSFSVGRG